MAEQQKNAKLNELELEKKELEIEKLRKELDKIDSEKIKIVSENIELNKAFFKKPQWWAFFTTAFVSAITLISLWVNGTFSLTKAKTERDLIILQTDKIKFEKEKEEQIIAFNEEKRKMDSILNEKADSIKAYSIDLSEFKKKNEYLITEKLALIKYNLQLGNSIKILSDSAFYKEQTAFRLQDSIKKLNLNIKYNEQWSKQSLQEITSSIRRDHSNAMLSLSHKLMDYEDIKKQLEKYKKELEICISENKNKN